MPIYFECRECQYDSDEAAFLIQVQPEYPICPMCAGDTGHDGQMVFREATAEEAARLKVI